MKHQEVKTISLANFDKLRYDLTELSDVFNALNDKIDKRLEFYDKEVCFKNSQLINKVKKSSINEYKKYMEKQVSPLVVFNIKSFHLIVYTNLGV